MSEQLLICDPNDGSKAAQMYRGQMLRKDLMRRRSMGQSLKAIAIELGINEKTAQYHYLIAKRQISRFTNQLLSA